MGGDENCTIRWLKENYSEHFERLYKMMYKRLYLFARNFLMDEELADDIVQEVFVGLWTKGKMMKLDIPLERYLFTSVRMKRVFAELPDMQRQVLVLSVVEGLKYREVAERLKISEGTVHTHIKRAYKYIKEHLLSLLLFVLLVFKW